MRLPSHRVHRYGGLYADLDLRPVAKVDDLLRGQQLLLPHTPNIGLTNAVMASVPGHPFLLFVLKELPKYAHAWYHTSKHNTVLSSTGSTFIWAMHMRWARDHPVEDSASLMPAADWGKCSYCDGLCLLPGKVEDPTAKVAVQLSEEEMAAAAAAGVAAALRTARSASAATQPGVTGVVSETQTAGGPAGSSGRGGHDEADEAATRSAAIRRALTSTSDGTPLSTRSRWHSPFAHGEGSSWHSIDSMLMLGLFCHLDLLFAVVASACVWFFSRSVRRTALTGVSLLLLAWLQRSLGIFALETLVGRPWIWLIMA
jgi:hypothetical protein